MRSVEPAELLASSRPGAQEMDAYERVLGDAMTGDRTLFAREDYVEEAWRIVDPVLKAGTPVFGYEPGTWGPKEVDRDRCAAGRLAESAGRRHSQMQFEVLADADAVAARAARLIAAAARDAVAARGRFVFAVSGGRTPWTMLRLLAREDVPWHAVHVVQVDERVAPANDPDRNLTHLNETLLANSPLPAASHPRDAGRSVRSNGRGEALRGRRCESLAGRRRCSISCISGSAPMATRRRWCPAIRCSTSQTPTSPSPRRIRAGAG